MAWAKDAGLINDGRPGDPVTRAELAAVTAKLLEAVKKADLLAGL